MQIGIVIVTYNGSIWIEKLFESFQYEPNLKIIVVDNASQDQTVDLIKKYRPETTIKVMDRNLGFGAANNIGIKYLLKIGCEYIALVNQDVHYSGPVISSICEKFARASRDFAIASPIHLREDGKKMDLMFYKNFSISLKNKIVADALVERELKEELYEIENVNAAFWVVKADAFKRIGLFDKIFSHYGEDNNLVQRLHYCGLKIGLDLHSKIYHNRKQVDFRRISDRYIYQNKAEIFYLVCLCDINFPIMKNYMRIIKMLLHMTFLSKDFKFANLVSRLIALIKIQFRLKEIIESRKRNRILASAEPLAVNKTTFGKVL